MAEFERVLFSLTWLSLPVIIGKKKRLFFYYYWWGKVKLNWTKLAQTQPRYARCAICISLFNKILKQLWKTCSVFSSLVLSVSPSVTRYSVLSSFRIQCAAVTTHSGLTSVPPHVKPTCFMCNQACQGHSPMEASAPEITLDCGTHDVPHWTVILIYGKQSKRRFLSACDLWRNLHLWRPFESSLERFFTLTPLIYVGDWDQL